MSGLNLRAFGLGLDVRASNAVGGVVAAVASVLSFNDYEPTYFYPGLIFQNIHKQMRAWASDGTDTSAEVEETGYFSSLPGDATQIDSTIDLTNMGDDVLTSWLVRWDGQGTMTATGAVSSVVVGSGQLTFTASSKSTVILRITALPSDTDYIRNVRVGLNTTAWTTRMDAGNTWTEGYVAALKPGGVPITELRAMNGMGTNNSTVADWSGAANTATRRALTTDAVQTERGVAVEYLVELANEIATDCLWLCVPHLATDAYVTAMAAYVKANLTTGIDCRMEYSNEVWNSVFTQYDYATHEAVKTWGTAITTITFTNGSAVT